MGNEAIARGAIAAGVRVACGYPGTPSTEVLETAAKCRREDMYVEWSVNEKTAMELAGGAAMCGARTLVTMKQMGLNVAADPLMCLAYLGVKGGLVVLVADDPGPISSQTEQDSRHFAAFAKVPCLDPSTAQEAYDMVFRAFELSEEYRTPVILRTTTRVSHGYASILVRDEVEYERHDAEGFVRDPRRWVIFPGLSRMNHEKMEIRNRELRDRFSRDPLNLSLEGSLSRGVACGGFSYTYVMESRRDNPSLPVLKISTPHPFPDALAAEFLRGKEEVLCVEELDPVIEENLIRVCGQWGLKTRILGKGSGHMPLAGENSRDQVSRAISLFLGKEQTADALPDLPPLPVRPPVLCAGCPHRASFYAVKQAMKGKKCIFCGDIGCYTLGNAQPLDMVDTCLCMGAGLGIAQAVNHLEPDTNCFAFVGDSTFFASAIPGVVNAVYNQADMTLVILDNSTTAMTGHQPHPGTGCTAMGQAVDKVDMEKVLRAIGVEDVRVLDPLDLETAVENVRELAEGKGVRAVIFRSPCVALFRSARKVRVDADKCIGCRKCIREIGCPALSFDGKHAVTDGQCNGCGLCVNLCPVKAISGGMEHA